MSITTDSPLTALINPATVKGRTPKPVAPLAPLTPSTTLQPPTAYPQTPATSPSNGAMEAFISQKLNLAGGQRMGGKSKAAGFTFANGPYAGLSTMQATEAAKKEWMDMHPTAREAWWSQNNPANGRTPSEGGPAATATASTAAAQPFGKLGAPAAPLAPVRSSVATTPPPAGNDWALAGQARSDAANGIVSRGTGGSAQYDNGATISPTATGRSLVSPYGTGSVTNGPRTAPSRINMTNTYDANFFKTAPTSLTPPTAAAGVTTPAPNQPTAPAPASTAQPPRNPAMDPWTGPDAASMAAADQITKQAAANVAARTSLQPPSTSVYDTGRDVTAKAGIYTGPTPLQMQVQKATQNTALSEADTRAAQSRKLQPPAQTASAY
jgi:hypothetical protein